jgi:hypothetical protein
MKRPNAAAGWRLSATKRPNSAAGWCLSVMKRLNSAAGYPLSATKRPNFAAGYPLLRHDLQKLGERGLLLAGVGVISASSMPALPYPRCVLYQLKSPVAHGGQRPNHPLHPCAVVRSSVAGDGVPPIPSGSSFAVYLRLCFVFGREKDNERGKERRNGRINGQSTVNCQL